MNNPVHPGAILREDVLAALGASVSDAAKSVGVARVTLTLGSAPVSGGAGSIAPAGGHKGSGLALMVEVLAAGLTGAHFSHQASSLGDDLGGPPRLGQTLIAIEPGGSGFAGRIEGLLADMTSEPGVRIPGDRRSANRRLTEAAGVTIDGDLMAQLRVLGGRL